jgi:flagellar hook-basal body complex protein FliE
MTVDPLGAIGVHDEVPGMAPVRPDGPAADAVPFGRLVSDGLQEVNRRLLASQVDLQGLALGDTHNLHEVMVRLEESRLALQLMLQVRSRVLEAYQEVMRMQV